MVGVALCKWDGQRRVGAEFKVLARARVSGLAADSACVSRDRDYSNDYIVCVPQSATNGLDEVAGGCDVWGLAKSIEGLGAVRKYCKLVVITPQCAPQREELPQDGSDMGLEGEEIELCGKWAFGRQYRKGKRAMLFHLGLLL